MNVAEARLQMRFERGDNVLCVDDDWNCDAFQLIAIPFRPIRGAMYTVREVYECQDDAEPAVGICLFELVNPVTAWADGFREGSFASRRFRPINGLSKESATMNAAESMDA
jgi:hypothetical protein